MDMTKVAYIRVSSTGQNLQAQREAVLKAGAEKIFEEKASGADGKRPVFKQCLDYLREGDVLIVTKADRFARSSADLLSNLKALTAKGVEVSFLDQKQLSTTEKYGKFMLTVLAGVAELERELIKERQQAGIAAAKKRGVKFGRPATVDQKATAAKIKELVAEGMSMSAAAKACGISRAMAYKVVGAAA